MSGSRVFHDLNENGIFDENNEVFVTSFDDGSFKGLHGDVAKPLVAVGGIDTSTGLSFKYKNSSGTENDITL